VRVTVSSCAGEVIAEFMLMSLMMKSGLYHQPAHSTTGCTKTN
jgi:hypothetical protein